MYIIYTGKFWKAIVHKKYITLDASANLPFRYWKPLPSLFRTWQYQNIKINTDSPSHSSIMHFIAIFFGLQSKPQNYVIITLRLGFLQLNVGMKWFQFLGRPEIVSSSSRIFLCFFPFLPHFTVRSAHSLVPNDRGDLVVMFAKMRCRSCSCSLVKRTSVLKAVRNVCNTFQQKTTLRFFFIDLNVISKGEGKWRLSEL